MAEDIWYDEGATATDVWFDTVTDVWQDEIEPETGDVYGGGPVCLLGVMP